MTAPRGAAARGYLVSFGPCGHVQHLHCAPAKGMWLSCWAGPRPGCQTQRQVRKVEPCPGCPDCWSQPPLFGALDGAA